MTNDILIIDGSYHLGNNAGLFQSSSFIGLKLALPLKQIWLNPEAENVSFIISTTDIETWGDWKGHKVSINDTEIDRLKDTNNAHGSREQFIIDLPKNRYLELLAGTDNFVLEVSLDRQESMPSFSDDFRLIRIASRNLAATIG